MQISAPSLLSMAVEAAASAAEKSIGTDAIAAPFCHSSCWAGTAVATNTRSETRSPLMVAESLASRHAAARGYNATYRVGCALQSRDGSHAKRLGENSASVVWLKYFSRAVWATNR